MQHRPALAGLQAEYRFLPPALARRLARAYGTRVRMILGRATSLDDLGEEFGGGLTRAELDYLIAQEWARAPDDVLWRRSKLGLHAPPGTAEKIAAYLAASAGSVASMMEEGRA